MIAVTCLDCDCPMRPPAEMTVAQCPYCDGHNIAVSPGPRR
jgi:Zn finger protein HypA/HybF involved in hydrogenase expression